MLYKLQDDANMVVKRISNLIKRLNMYIILWSAWYSSNFVLGKILGIFFLCVP